MDIWSERLIGSEDANTYLADQWLSYINITSGGGDTVSFSFQSPELHKIFDEFATTSESCAETERFFK
jgi:hypothetical protein